MRWIDKSQGFENRYFKMKIIEKSLAVEMVRGLFRYSLDKWVEAPDKTGE